MKQITSPYSHWTTKERKGREALTENAVGFPCPLAKLSQLTVKNDKGQSANWRIGAQRISVKELSERNYKTCI